MNEILKIGITIPAAALLLEGCAAFSNVETAYKANSSNDKAKNSTYETKASGKSAKDPAVLDNEAFNGYLMATGKDPKTVDMNRHVSEMKAYSAKFAELSRTAKDRFTAEATERYAALLKSIDSAKANVDKYVDELSGTSNVAVKTTLREENKELNAKIDGKSDVDPSAYMLEQMAKYFAAVGNDKFSEELTNRLFAAEGTVETEYKKLAAEIDEALNK